MFHPLAVNLHKPLEARCQRRVPPHYCATIFVHIETYAQQLHLPSLGISEYDIVVRALKAQEFQIDSLAKFLTGNVLANLQRHIVKARIENLYLLDKRPHIRHQPPLNALQALNRNGTVRKAQQQVGITVNNRA